MRDYFLLYEMNEISVWIRVSPAQFEKVLSAIDTEYEYDSEINSDDSMRTDFFITNNLGYKQIIGYYVDVLPWDK